MSHFLLYWWVSLSLVVGIILCVPAGIWLLFHRKDYLESKYYTESDRDYGFWATIFLAWLISALLVYFFCGLSF